MLGNKSLAPLAVLIPSMLVLAPCATAQWSEASLSHPRSGIAAVRVADLAIFAGGRDANGPSDVVDLYDAASGGFTRATLALPRSNAAAAASGRLAMVAGGIETSGDSSLLVDVFDAATGLWSTASLSVARHDLVGVALGDWILFAGGQDQDYVKYAVVDLYHVPSGAWSVASLSAARSDVAAAVAGGRALLAGGFWSIAVDEFDPAGGWDLDVLWQKRGSIGATACGERAVFAGGLDAGFLPSAVVDIYDAAADDWIVRELSEARAGIAAASTDALALFAGGWNEHGSPYAPDATLDIYDSVAGTWSETSLPAPRADLAVVAFDHYVLFAGGLDAAMQPSDTVWIYHPPLAGRSYCFGAGEGSPCPCGNLGAAREGCRNSTAHGASLLAGGSASAGDDDLLIEAEHLPPGQPVLLFAGTARIAGGDGIPLGDGLRCAGSAVQRLGVHHADSAGRALFGPSLAEQADAASGETLRFQAWYRDPIGGPCGAGFNLSNAVEVRFVP